MICLFFVGFGITSFFWGLGMVLQGLNSRIQFGMRTKKIKVYTLIEVNVLYVVFLYLNETFFGGVGSYAKFCVLSQLIIFIVLLHPCL